MLYIYLLISLVIHLPLKHQLHEPRDHFFSHCVLGHLPGTALGMGQVIHEQGAHFISSVHPA